MYRDLTMKEISEQQIGQTLQVAGWVENIRDHGGVSFIDLRDMYGVLQVVIRKPELLCRLKIEGRRYPCEVRGWNFETDLTERRCA